MQKSMTLVLSLLDACYMPLCKLIHVKEGAAVQIALAMASRGCGSRFPVAGIFPGTLSGHRIAQTLFHG